MNNIVFLIVIPLITAGFLPLLTLIMPTWRRAPWLLVLLVNLVMLVYAASMSLLLFFQQAAGNDSVISTIVGNWNSIVGIELSLSMISSVMILLILLCSVIALANDHSRQTLQHLSNKRVTFFYTIWLLYIVSLLGICLTSDLFNLFVFLELSTLCTCVLLSQGSDPKAYLTAYRYLILGIIGGGFYLLGAGILYTITGSFNFAIIASSIYELPAINHHLVYITFIMFFLAIMIKAAVFPLYFWLPQAYVYAPFNVTMLIASIGTKINLYILYKLLFEVELYTLLLNYLYDIYLINTILVVLTLGAILMSMTACYQRDIRAALGFNSIASMSLIFALLIYNPHLLYVTLVYIMSHALAVLMFLLVLGNFWPVAKPSLSADRFYGLAHNYPARVVLLALAILSVVGLPGSAMFTAKWLFLEIMLYSPHLAQSDLWFSGYFWLNISLIFALLFSSVMTLCSLGKFVYLSHLHQDSSQPVAIPANSKVSFRAILMLLFVLQAIIFVYSLDVRNLVIKSLREQRTYRQVFVKPQTKDSWDDVLNRKYLARFDY